MKQIANSRFMIGSVLHSRIAVHSNSFKYNVVYCVFDLDELESGNSDQLQFFNSKDTYNPPHSNSLATMQTDPYRYSTLIIWAKKIANHFP
jgi:DUF1365 family protein